MEQTSILAIQVLPQMKSEDALAVIDKAIEVIKQSGVTYRVCPFETVIEGQYEKLMQVVEQAQQTCFQAGAERVLTNLKIERFKEGDLTIKDVMDKFED
jgi:uncharacterized protein YqgV (UPF0045/DUF77 family)